MFLILLDRPWDNPPLDKIYLEKYRNRKSGILSKKELWKGFALYIEFRDQNRKLLSFKKDTATFSIGNNSKTIEQIHLNDYFHKIPKSNKCFIIGKDSIMFFNCKTNIRELLNDSVENIIE